jgi:anti-sigma regulatory factor (Ser/Thr protein kinase)
VGTLLVRPDPASASHVRREIAADLRRGEVTPDSVHDVLLVVSELVSNAVVHTPTPPPSPTDQLDVGWDLHDHEVFVRVNDSSPGNPSVRVADDQRSGGRGLAIVAAIASEWGVRPVTCGKQVWARIPVRLAV